MKHIYIVADYDKPLMAFECERDAYEFAGELYPETERPDVHITPLMFVADDTITYTEDADGTD